MPGDFDFFNDEPKAAPKAKPAPPPKPQPPPVVEPEIEFDPIDEDDPPMAAPAPHRAAPVEPEERPRYGTRRTAEPKKKPSGLVIGGIIAGAIVLIGGGVVGI